RELLELRPGALGDDSGDRRLAHPRRAVEDQRRCAVLVDRSPQRRTGAEDVRLADELVERSRPHALGEGCGFRLAFLGCVREEVTHATSMLRPWPETLPRTTRSPFSRAPHAPI